MKRTKSALENFFSRFSYTSKLRVVLFCGYLPCILILIYSLILFERPRRSLTKQIQGVEYYRKMNAMIEAITQYVQWIPLEGSFLQSNQKNQLETRIDNDLFLLAKMNKNFEFEANKVLTNDLLEMSTHFNLLQEAWENLKKDAADVDAGKEEVDNMEIILNSQTILLQYLAKASNLVLNFDYGTRYYIYALLRNLSMMQYNVVNLRLLLDHAKKENSPSLAFLAPIEADKNELASNSFLLLKNVQEAIYQNEIFQVQPYYDELMERLQTFDDTSQHFIHEVKILLENLALPRTQMREAASHLLAESFILSEKMGQQLEHVLQSQRDTLSYYLLYTFLLITLGGSIVALLYFTRLIRRPLQHLKEAAGEFSRINFSVRVPVTFKDEVGEIAVALNEMMSYFENILAEATQISRHLSESSAAIIDSAKQLETNINVQEKTVKEMAFNARGIMEVIQHFAEDILKVSSSAVLTSTLASSGRSNILVMEDIMQQMIRASSNIVRTLTSLQEKVGNINKVIETIIKIADQSNLLSLNTAIRASKSGGQGRGFVVIADKIREMANQIAFATLDIEQVIKEIVSKVLETANKVGEFSADIQKQAADAADINEDLNKLITNTQNQIHYFQEINDGMQLQSKGILEINRSMEKLREVSQHTAKSVHKLYAEIEYLHDSSQNLYELTEKFVFSNPPT